TTFRSATRVAAFCIPAAAAPCTNSGCSSTSARSLSFLVVAMLAVPKRKRITQRARRPEHRGHGEFSQSVVYLSFRAKRGTSSFSTRIKWRICFFWKSWEQIPCFILPCWILFFDERHLLGSHPSLDNSFASNGQADTAEHFVVYQPVNPMP